MTDDNIWLDATVKYNGETYKLSGEPWWEDDDFIIPLSDGSLLRCKNAWLQSLTFDGLESVSTDFVTLTGSNQRYPFAPKG